MELRIESLYQLETVIQTLLEVGAEPTMKNFRRDTPLEVALDIGTLNVAELPMRHTPVGMRSRYGETSLQREKIIKIVEPLLKLSEDPKSRYSIAAAGHNKFSI
uniref:Uncharacterized protein n=1 Tax=Bracon brevicornis TaxID=1563983 RepID=A0A6V7M1A3_9HYME